MSLATGGAGGFAGGGLSTAAMAHGPNSAMAVHRAHAQPPPGADAPPGTATAAPGTSYAALGADLIDKNQNLSLKAVKNMADLPIVAVDLYGGGEVSYFPPVNGENGEEEVDLSSKRPVKLRSMGRLGSGTEKGLILKRNDDAAYKAVRRLLSKSRGVDSVIDNAIVEDGSETADTVTIPRPYLLLGARCTSNLTSVTLDKFEVEEDDNSPAISEETAAPKSGVSLRNGTLDGSSAPTGDDFDRVAVRLWLKSGKKPLSILPEEAIGIMVAKAKRLVYRSWSAGGGEEVEVLPDDEEDDEGAEDAYLPYPVAYAVPGWACADPTVEALLDASASGPNPAVAYQRSVAALVGSLLPHQKGSKHKLLSLMAEEVKRLREAFEKELREAEAAGGEDTVSPSQSAFQPLVLTAGVTADGLELTAAQLSNATSEPHCPFSTVNVIATVNYRTDEPFDLLEKAMGKLREEVGRNLPESPGPSALIMYGTVGMQVKLKAALTKLLKAYAAEAEKNNVSDDDDDGFDERISIVSTGEECVSDGLSVLAATSHGRIYRRGGEEEGKSRKAKPTLSVHDVAATAVGIRMNYNGDKNKNSWSKVKVVFDFDRRVPAGPYQVDLTAAECAAFRNEPDDVDFDADDGEKLEAATKKYEGGKMIPMREEAARGFRLQVVQMSERGGTWMPVGDVMKPLTIEDSQADDKESDESRIACESAVLEVSVGAAGVITTTLMTDGKSVLQATKSARNSTIRYYFFILLAILFFGGFLVKSYWEEKVFDRDTRRVLAFYKHAAPGSIHDGDERQARYLVWKYKNKKDKLWRRLEVKYGQPVLQEWEWPEDDEEKKEDEEIIDDLDTESETEEEDDEQEL